MSGIRRGVAACAAIVFACLCAWSAEQASPGTITVTGEAEVRVVPDEVVLSIGLETWDYSLDSAKGLNDSCTKAVVEASKGHGVDEKLIQTDHLTIEPEYAWEGGYRRTGNFVGYFVRERLVITVKNVNKFSDILASALDKGRTTIPGEKRETPNREAGAKLVLGGAIYVLGVQFRTTELRKHRDQARVLAINAAREKAIALAAELNQSVGEPKNIMEQPFNYWEEAYWYSPWWGWRQGGSSSMSQNVVQSSRGEPGAAGDGMALGEIPVKARIQVTFELTERRGKQ